ncbi:MAG: LOG family protein [Planctomycetota bacterium]
MALDPDTYHYDFRQGEPWRMFRIMGEFVEGTEELARIIPAVSVFGSARTKPDHKYYKMATVLSKELADAGFNIVTGGGPGIMEGANKGANESGRTESVGLNIELPFEQHANPYITKMLSFRYFFVRKVMFLKYSCAVVVLPGGFGTLDELFEVITLIQTKKISECPVYLMGVEYWQGLVDWIRDGMLAAGAIGEKDLELFTMTDDVDEVVGGIAHFCRANEHHPHVGEVPPGDGM